MTGFELVFMAFISCGPALDHDCVYDPAMYDFPRTKNGCIAFVAALTKETNYVRVIEGADVCKQVSVRVAG